MTDHPMPGAELTTVREHLGLTVERLAARLAVHPRTVRAWEQGRYPIPPGVRAEIEGLETFTADAVERVVEGLADKRDPAVAVWRGEHANAAMSEMRPDIAELGPRWWRHVAYRAASEIPGTIIGTTDEIEAALADAINTCTTLD